MPYFTNEQIKRAREIDLLTHDSLKISNGKRKKFPFAVTYARSYQNKSKKVLTVNSIRCILQTTVRKGDCL